MIIWILGRRAFAPWMLVALLIVLLSSAYAAHPPSSWASPLAVILRPPDLWSFSVESRRLLADVGYVVAYAFEFYDEEQIRLTGVGERPEVVEATFRTILDGDPAFAQIRLRGEEQALWIVQNAGNLQAARMTEAGLREADVPTTEVRRRLDLLASLMRQTRQRLGLALFRPSVDPRVRVDVGLADSLALIPGAGPIERYEIRQPGTPAVVETLVVRVQDQTWTVAWKAPDLTVTILTGRRAESQTYRLRRGTRPVGTAATAISLLLGARSRFGTAPAVPPLP